MIYRIELECDDRLEHTVNKFFERVLKAYTKTFGWTMVNKSIRLMELTEVKKDGTEVWAEVEEFKE